MLARVWGNWCRVAGKAGWCCRYRKQCRGSSKSENQNYHVIQQSHLWVSVQKYQNQDLGNMSAPAFTAVPLTLAKVWEQPEGTAGIRPRGERQSVVHSGTKVAQPD